MMGLKICTRWRAISARRSRRISSSLLPLNMGPQITSIQPRFPRIAFIPRIPFPFDWISGSILTSSGRQLRRLAAHETAKSFEVREDFSGASQQPPADFCYRHPADQVHGNAQTVSEGQLALGTRAASPMVVPVANDGVGLALDQIEII